MKIRLVYVGDRFILKVYQGTRLVWFAFFPTETVSKIAQVLSWTGTGMSGLTTQKELSATNIFVPNAHGESNSIWDYATLAKANLSRDTLVFTNMKDSYLNLAAVLVCIKSGLYWGGKADAIPALITKPVANNALTFLNQADALSSYTARPVSKRKLFLIDQAVALSANIELGKAKRILVFDSNVVGHSSLIDYGNSMDILYFLHSARAVSALVDAVDSFETYVLSYQANALAALTDHVTSNETLIYDMVGNARMANVHKTSLTDRLIFDKTISYFDAMSAEFSSVDDYRFRVFTSVLSASGVLGRMKHELLLGDNVRSVIANVNLSVIKDMLADAAVTEATRADVQFGYIKYSELFSQMRDNYINAQVHFHTTSDSLIFDDMKANYFISPVLFAGSKAEEVFQFKNNFIVLQSAITEARSILEFVSKAVAETESVFGPWEYPVQTDTNLLITQVHTAIQSETHLTIL